MLDTMVRYKVCSYVRLDLIKKKHGYRQKYSLFRRLISKFILTASGFVLGKIATDW